jgi:hypothetical protein
MSRISMQRVQLLSTNVYPSLTPPVMLAARKDPRGILPSAIFPTSPHSGRAGGRAKGLASGAEENSLCTGVQESHLGP